MSRQTTQRRTAGVSRPARRFIEVNDATGQFAPPSDAGRQAFRDALTVELGTPVVPWYRGGKNVEGGCGMLAGQAARTLSGSDDGK